MHSEAGAGDMSQIYCVLPYEVLNERLPGDVIPLVKETGEFPSGFSSSFPSGLGYPVDAGYSFCVENDKNEQWS